MENQKVIVPDCLKGMKYLHPGYGPAFRKMLEPPDVAADFINSILHTDKGCNAINLTATFEKPVDVFYPEKKTFFFDAHVSMERRYMDVELQRMRHKNFVDRIVLYGAYHIIHSKRLLEIARENEKLENNEILRRRYELPKLISLWICNFTPRPDVQECDGYRDYWALYSSNDLKQEIPLPVSEKIKYLIIDLPKFVKANPKVDSREAFWLHLIANGVQAVPETDDPVFCKAIDNLLVVNASQELLDKQKESMTYNYSHERDDFEAMLLDTKTDAHNEGLDEGLENGFKIFKTLGVSEEVLAKARQMADAQSRK